MCYYYFVGIFKYESGNRAVTCTAFHGLSTPKSKQWQYWFYRVNTYLKSEYFKLLMYIALYFQNFLYTDKISVEILVGELLTIES